MYNISPCRVIHGLADVYFFDSFHVVSFIHVVALLIFVCTTGYQDIPALISLKFLNKNYLSATWFNLIKVKSNNYFFRFVFLSYLISFKEAVGNEVSYQ